MEHIQGQVKSIIFRNSQNGWTVMELVDDTGDEITAVGDMPLCSPGERIELCGDYVEHHSYGRQFKAVSCATLAPADTGALISYLGSGLIKGVGMATAKSIVALFGMDTIQILEQAPERLKEIPGIGNAKSQLISKSFFEQRAMREIMMGLNSYGITVRQAMRLYQLYGMGAKSVIEENPYRLIEDVPGIGFITADKIAMKMGIERDSIKRMKAGVLYMLLWSRGEGHTYLPKNILLEGAAAQLQAPMEPVEEALDSLIIDKTLHYCNLEDGECIYLPSLYYMERDCAKRLLLLLDKPPDNHDPDTERNLTYFEKEKGITLAPQQKIAIQAALTEGAMVITGGPGTGKTTIIQFVLCILQQMGLDFALCAPTGRAAKRMSEATGFDAATIHRLLEYGGEGQPVFARNEENPLLYDMIVVDEMSMVDLPLFFALLKALPKDARLIMVGDSDQLPPVGAGTVLHDIIKSNILKVVRLKEIFRQSERSGIAYNAQRINEGKAPDNKKYDDFIFVPSSTQKEAMDQTLKICKGEEFTMDIDILKDLQVLSPMKKGPLGVYALNSSIQSVLNPPMPHKAEREYQDTLFREGDKVMQIKNNYKMEWTKTDSKGRTTMGMGVFNGDMGILHKINTHDQTMQVLFDDDRLCEYTFTQTDELELAYCISIHKSQGSEFLYVALPLFSGPPMLMTRNLLYTAVTRARQQVIILGNWASVLQMVENKRQRKRYSALHEQLFSLAPYITKK